MNLLADCVDSLIHAFRIIAQSIAFLFGAHFFLLLHLVHFLATDPVAALQRQPSSPTPSSRDCHQSSRARTRRELEEARSRRRITVASTRYRPPRRFLHLPSLEPRPYDETQHYAAKSLSEYASIVIATIKFRMTDEMQGLGDHLESRGGKTAKMMQYIRNRKEEQLKPSLLNRLPFEIINHVLLIAAEEEPTKICLLSKLHHRLVLPRLYSEVNLSDPKIFRLFRITLAVHNSRLGELVHSLSIASNTFDNQGYLPEGIAEPAALGVGIEQILLATPNLKHLYLDLFAIAALHDGTASRLETGALPISLVTEYAAPQYLALPIFDELRHVELSVFGLDMTAAEHLRKALPKVKSLTLRWVTREDQDVKEGENDLLGVANTGKDEFDDDVSTFDSPWKVGGYMRNDFDSFVEAINSLRESSEHRGSDQDQLAAITVLAWPRATLELSRSFQLDDTVSLLSVEDYHQQKDNPFWNRSYDQTLLKPAFDRRSRRATKMANSLIYERSTSKKNIVPATTSTPLRLCVDDTHNWGPRRGPLESWCSQR